MQISYLKEKEIPKGKSPIYFVDIEIEIQGKKKSDITKEVMCRIVCKGRNREEVMKSIYERVKLGKGSKKKDYVIINIVLLKQLGFGVLEN